MYNVAKASRDIVPISLFDHMVHIVYFLDGPHSLKKNN